MINYHLHMSYEQLKYDPVKKMFHRGPYVSKLNESPFIQHLNSFETSDSKFVSIDLSNVPQKDIFTVEVELKKILDLDCK